MTKTPSKFRLRVANPSVTTVTVWTILALPSAWIFFSFPVLWRDSDAFWQISGKPGVATILHWPPLYCFLARIPLALGACWEAVFASGVWPEDWWSKPIITDTGLQLLLLAQHAALVTAWGALVFTLTSSRRWQVVIAAWFALQSWSYGFAQTVGSESLGTALLIAFAAAGLRSLRFDASAGIWLTAAGLLCLAILTRHIHAVFAAALPGAVLLLAIADAIQNRRWPAKAWVRFGVAVAVGIGAILGASLVLRGASALAEIPYRSRMGYTFQWRLNYLLQFTPTERTAIVNTLADASKDPRIASAIRAIPDGIRPDGSWHNTHLNDVMVALVDASSDGNARTREAEKDEKLNALARQFLSSPSARLWPSVVADFLKSMRTSFGQVAVEPLMTTDFLRRARDEKRFAKIATLRALQGGAVAQELTRVGAAYLAIGTRIPLWLPAVIAIVFASVGICRSPDSRPSGAWAIALILTGVLATFLSVALTFQAPRFLLPLAAAVSAALPIAALAVSRKRSPTNGQITDLTARRQP